jgi:medium-chain acyl-[acyl-carrier-protein] hydrolase
MAPFGPARILGDLPDGMRRAVVCFHHAGGSAHSFTPCLRHFPPDTALLRAQLPGRAGLPGTTPDHIEAVVEPLAGILAERLAAAPAGMPFIFYGHSLGAIVAFELTRHLRATGGRMPLGLVVSSRRAPQCPLAGEGLYGLPDEVLIKALAGLGGPLRLLLHNRTLLDRLLPSIKADLRMSDLYRYCPEPPLDMPILAFMGTRDPILTAAELAAWGRQTIAGFVHREIEGTHFFDETGSALLRAEVLATFDLWIGAQEGRERHVEHAGGA